MDGEAEQEQEALRLRVLAETKYRDSNLKSALKYVKRAQRLHPNLDGVSEMLTSFKILRVSANSPDDWYRILQLEPFAHINTIKKQYKKLALILHPDKNPYLGSEEAFKLVCEAFRFLSDKIRRKEYDMKLRIQIQDEKIGVWEVAEEIETFWTVCSTCRLLHQFEKRYVGHNLVCPSCRKSFKAVEVSFNESRSIENANVVGSRKSNSSSTQNSSSFHESEDSASKHKGHESNGQAASAGNGMRNGDFDEEIDSDEDDSIWSSRRLRSGSLRKRMSSVDDILERSKPKPIKMEDEMMTLAELQSQVIERARQEKLKLKLKGEEKAEERSNKRKKGERKSPKNSGSSENVKQRNSNKSKNIEIQMHCSDSDVIMVEDSDFYDFDNDRLKFFKKGQVWAIYDDDGMPRHYGLLQKVTLNHPFEVRMSWLDLQNNGDERLIHWEKMGFHISCGRFKVSKETSIDSLKIFSHVVDSERAAREVYRIYPKKGSIWALYKEEEEPLDEEKRVKDKQTYDIGLFLTTYSEVHGLSMAYLEKVDGYKTIFRRREIGYHAIRWFEKDDIRYFSHQIPARKLCRDETPEHLKDCWELDPASLPSDFLSTCQRR